ncbi:MAG: ATP-dependent DNA ligase [Methanobacterium sp.]|nr:ATP-dependent DNA ligase [Methanobacterium sp.]
MIEPMLAQLTSADVKLTGTWISEPKIDGQRIIAQYKDKKITLWTRRHLQVAFKFPELVEALKKNIKGDEWVLDGELTVPGGFGHLISRNVEDEFRIKLLARKIPATYHIFDIIRYEGEELINTPLLERKKLLMRIVYLDERTDIVPFKEVRSSTIKEHFAEYTARGFEGAILKNADSLYEPGKRTGQWLKIKKEETVDVNIIGATKSDSLPFGALIMERNGEFFGKVGTGFTDQDRRDILKLLEENEGPLNIKLPPEIESEVLVSTKPLFAEIKVNELIKDRSPRAPVWVRFRGDL